MAPTHTPTPSNEGNSQNAQSRVGVRQVVPPAGVQYPWWSPDAQDHPITASFTTPSVNNLVDTGQTVQIDVTATDVDLRFTDANTTSYSTDTLVYTWTCDKGRFVSGGGVPATPDPDATTVRWEAIDPATGQNLSQSIAKITCTVNDKDDANKPANESGTRDDVAKSISIILNVGRLTFGTGSILSVNDSYDEKNLNQQGLRVADNREHWSAGATTGVHRMLATDNDLLDLVVNVRTPIAMSGTLNITVPSQLQLWYLTPAGTYVNVATGPIAITNASAWSSTLKVEGINASGQVDDAFISCRFIPDAPYQPVNYGLNNAKKITVINTNLDVGNVFSGTSAYQGANEEEPGVFLPINDDFDRAAKDANGNPIADKDDTATSLTDAKVAADDELRDATLTLGPMNVTGKWKMLIPAHLKVWRKVSDVWKPLSSDVYTSQFTIDGTNNPVNLKIEGLAIGGGAPDCKLLFLPAGATHLCEDKVMVNVAKFDLDVTNNGSIDDPDDKAINYLPGYSGDTRVLSNGTSFNTAAYQGQQMQLVLKGVGTELTTYLAGCAVTKVEFKVESVSVHSGFCENGFDAKVGWDGTTADSGKDDDYSFEALSDSRDANNNNNPIIKDGTIAVGKTTVPLWCKDYGGRAVIKADVKAGLITVGTYTLNIPLDEEKDTNGNIIGDGIADKWEKEKIKEWNIQFAQNITVNNAFFGSGDDKELIDPDGANTDGGMDMGNHKSAGDEHTVLQEYRGVIFDGGGYDGDGAHNVSAFGIGKIGMAFSGGHVRLSPALKEMMIAVDAMEGVTEIPDAAGIQVWMEAISKGFSDKDSGSGCRLFYVLRNLQTPYDNFSSNFDFQVSAGKAYNYAQSRINEPSYAPLRQFKHLQFARALGPLGIVEPGTAGLGYNDVGAIILAKALVSSSQFFRTPLSTYAPAYISHELHHVVIEENGDVEKVVQSDFTEKDNGSHEHFNDTNGDGTAADADDKTRVLWNYNSSFYRTQSKTLTAAIAANATTISLNNTTSLTSTGWIRLENAAHEADYIIYTGINGNDLTGCSGVNFSYAVGDSAIPVYSGEEMKQIKFGHGTRKFIYDFVP